MRPRQILLCLLASGVFLHAEGPRKFRTDSDGPLKAADSKRKGKTDEPGWFLPVDGEFPPEGSAHAVSGELIRVDHTERRFEIRVDRNDQQDRGVFDLPLDAVMLPYGAIYYHGAPAALQDIPLGTHLHGLFYLRSPKDSTPPVEGSNSRRTPESDFRRCFLLEDDFTHSSKHKQRWRIESVDLEQMKLSLLQHIEGKPAAKPQVFDLLTSTRVLVGNATTGLTALQKGQEVLFNLTWATLYGPGRILDIWLDDASREAATALQLERHRNHIRERGIPGWITAVEDEPQNVTITFFGGIDPSLFDALTKTDPNPKPGSREAERPDTAFGSVAVARENLMTYDPVNDRKGCELLEVKKIPVLPGSSGVQIQVKCDMMLEGYRPKRIVRYYAGTWKVVALPREEEFYGRE